MGDRVQWRHIRGGRPLPATGWRHLACSGRPTRSAGGRAGAWEATVLGDTNFDLLKTAACDVRRYGQILDDLNLKQIVVNPTRPASGALLDHVIVRTTDSTTSASVVPCAWSDHDLVIQGVFLEIFTGEATDIRGGTLALLGAAFRIQISAYQRT